MNKIEFEIVTLTWKKADYKEFPSKSGIYQIYGTSPIYGLDTLLYIGKAKNLNDRIKDHFDNEGVIGRQPNKNCRYAEVPEGLLEYVEETLIIMHKPSFNSARLIQIGKKLRDRAIYIQNHGERGILSIETTNFYFLKQAEINNDKAEVFASKDEEPLA